jgi:hypothetical protein
MLSRANCPITVALVDDYDVVLMGVANMFDQYRDRVVVAGLDSNEPSKVPSTSFCTTLSRNRNQIMKRLPFWLPIRAHAES